MTASFREVQALIRGAGDDRAVALVDPDGMVVAGVPEQSEELEGLAAVATASGSSSS